MSRGVAEMPNSTFNKSAHSNIRDYNVLFIVVDDLRPQLHCYGHEQIISPNIDRLAARGTVFNRAYCQQALCAPSRASLLTGCRPDTTQIWDLKRKVRQAMPHVLTLPEHFKNHGYHTMSLGKVYHHPDDDLQGWSEHPWYPRNPWPGYITRQAEEIHQKYWNQSVGVGPPVEYIEVIDEAYPDGQLTFNAIQALQRIKDQRFFLAIGFYKPHLAFACPKRYWDFYLRDKISLTENPLSPRGVPPIALHNWDELRRHHGIPKKGSLSDDQARELIHGYYACVSFIDAQIGKLLNELERLGLNKNTVVVLFGDNGWHLGDNGLWCKHSNFEVATHCPLIVSVPGQKAVDSKTDALTEFVDLYPSLCEICNLPLPDHLEGTSFVSLLNDPDLPWKEAAFSQIARPGMCCSPDEIIEAMGYVIRTDRYRYVEWIQCEGNKLLGKELYDYDSNPLEKVNIVDDPEKKSIVQDLAKKLRAAFPKGIWKF